MQWIPHGIAAASSSPISGSGTYELGSLLFAPNNAPDDGITIFRYDLTVAVVSYDSARIWNQLSAGIVQLRGGRFLLEGDEGVGEEYFVGRPQNKVRNLVYYDTDNAETPQDYVGSGIITVVVTPSHFNGRFCKRIRYGLEPSVVGQVLVFGTYMHVFNENNAATLKLERN